MILTSRVIPHNILTWTENDSSKSYYWGSRFSCDIPFRTFEASLKFSFNFPILVLYIEIYVIHTSFNYEDTIFYILNLNRPQRKSFPTRISFFGQAMLRPTISGLTVNQSQTFSSKTSLKLSENIIPLRKFFRLLEIMKEYQ